jgi:oxygen-independent coproporphyrinogen-3 oxidase
MISPHETLATPPLDLALIRKYTVNAPRYTSYPPATRFTTELGPVRIEDAIAADNADGAARPLSLYVHLPFCESRCWYCGCTTVITRDRGAADLYLNDLGRELALYNRRLDPDRRVVQLHLGGGTPTFLSPAQLDRLAEILRCYFRFDDDAEISVELDPRRFSEGHVAALKRLGATRASLGVQDTDTRVQVAIHRYQPHELNERAVAWLRAAGFTSINVDLIYGLPRQTQESFARTLDDVLALAPDRLSVFGYAHVPWMKPAQKIFDDRGQLPDAEERLALWALARARLTAAGYVDVGLDHFAKPDDELALALRTGGLHRNFQGYSTRAGASLYAFGMSAISGIGDVYFQNQRTLPDYRAALAADTLPVQRGLRLNADDLRRRTIIMRLMCERGLGYAELSRELCVDFPNEFASEIASFVDLEADGLVQRQADGLSVTAAGLPLLRVIAQRFDACTEVAPRQHSRAL